MWYSMGARSDRSRPGLLRVARPDDGAAGPGADAGAGGGARRQFLEWNDTEANRGYYYNYYLDNCSTRVRDAIDRALGGQLKAQFDTMPSGHTWRWETRRILGWNLPLYVVINLALGHPVDTEMTAWQAMFLPLRRHGIPADRTGSRKHRDSRCRWCAGKRS